MFALNILHARRILISKFSPNELLNNMIPCPNFCLLNTRHASLFFLPQAYRIFICYLVKEIIFGNNLGDKKCVS